MDSFITSQLFSSFLAKLHSKGFDSYISKIKEEYIKWENDKKNINSSVLLKCCILYNITCKNIELSSNDEIDFENVFLDFYFKKVGEKVSMKINGKVEELYVLSKKIEKDSSVLITYKRKDGTLIYRKYFD